MRIQQVLRPLGELIESRATINLNPMWQRGPTWKPPRQVLLVDSNHVHCEWVGLGLAKRRGAAPVASADVTEFEIVGVAGPPAPHHRRMGAPARVGDGAYSTSGHCASILFDGEGSRIRMLNFPGKG